MGASTPACWSCSPPPPAGPGSRPSPTGGGSRNGDDGGLEIDDGLELGDDEHPGKLVAEATRASGAGVLSSVALADGWVTVPEGREAIPEGETVAVEDWEWSA